ncbi:deaminated glutathione amidase [Enterobacteriaceae bacterium H18W14]|uniref:deaminated glutathione amidase n=1 Tax=Dryocola boscaweniae TaxID=2925397 RepID=UPI0022F0CE08|nr:deaminated glutathione amidase [Dryocola boscaweniae]MCT4716156.1 deaminated glutathione amidase [Dryocola boscaweniae]
MKVAVGQFAVGNVWQDNARTCVGLMAQAASNGAKLLVLPEAVLARDDKDPDMSVNSAQEANGEFLHVLLEESRKNALTTVLTLHIRTTTGRAANTLLVLRAGEVISRYQKIHLYDAFSMQESRLVDAGNQLAPVIDVAGMKVGLLTCYDLRFPEMALSLALAGAEVLVLPAAWLRGPHKELHWSTLLAARALDTTCYVVASGECGNRNIGQSKVIDPLGVTIAGAAQAPALIYAELESERVSAVRAMLPVLKNRRFAAPRLF